MSFPPSPLWVGGPDGPWAPLLQELSGNGVALVAAALPDWRRALPAAADLPGLLGDDVARYRATGSADAQERLVATRMLLKSVAAVAVCADLRDLELCYGMAGRLSIRGHDQVDLSLSHAGDIMLAGITSLGLIGVDVERADRELRGQGIEERMCTPRELWRLAQLDAAQQNELLLRLWTLKEAYSKALGQGMHFPFAEFGFRLSGDHARLERADGTPVQDPTWRFATCPVPGGYLAAIAVQSIRAPGPADTRAHTALNRQILQVIHDRPGG